LHVIEGTYRTHGKHEKCKQFSVGNIKWKLPRGKLNYRWKESMGFNLDKWCV